MEETGSSAQMNIKEEGMWETQEGTMMHKIDSNEMKKGAVRLPQENIQLYSETAIQLYGKASTSNGYISIQQTDKQKSMKKMDVKSRIANKIKAKTSEKNRVDMEGKSFEIAIQTMLNNRYLHA